MQAADQSGTPAVITLRRSVPRPKMDVDPMWPEGGRATTEATEEKAMQLSARNQLQGTVVDVTKGETTAHVRINVSGTRLMASITNEAVDELKLANGITVYAIIKASDVIVGID